MLSLLGTRNINITISSLFFYRYIVFHHFTTAFTLGTDLRLSQHVGEESVALVGVVLEVLEVIGHVETAQNRLCATLENTDVVELVVAREDVRLVTFHHVLQVQVLVGKIHICVHAVPLLGTLLPKPEGGEGRGVARAADTGAETTATS